MLLPNEVGVAWAHVEHAYHVYTAEDEYVVVFRGTATEVWAWLRAHSYVCTWSLTGSPVLGTFVRKERA